MILYVLTLLFLALILYVYVGYPVLLLILGKILDRKIKKAEVTPRISLIVSAYNEQDVISEKIENLLELEYPRNLLEIIIVSDGSTDKTADIVADCKDVLLMHSSERRGKAAAMNRAAAQAQGDILVFSDANAFYRPHALLKLARNFNDPEVGCVSGKKTVLKNTDSPVADSEGFYWKYESFIKQQETLLGSTVGVAGEILAIRKQLYTSLPELTMTNDDAYLAMRVLHQGFRVVYEPEAVSWETSAVSTGEEVVRRQRINAGRYHVLFKPRELWPMNQPLALFELISHKFLRLLLPFFMIGAFLLNVWSVIRQPGSVLLTVTLWVQVVCYVLAFLGSIFESKGWRSKILSIPYYVVSSNFAALRGFFRYMLGKQSVAWEKAARAKLVGVKDKSL